MSSYHSSFTYLDRNSADEGFIIASFEADNGEKDTFLGMDQITTDSYDGVKKFFYGNRYNSTPIISITLVKADRTEFSIEDNRKVLRWLTGSRQATWLDLYEGDEVVYSFCGNFTASYQQKLDARVIGIRLEFTSIYPWAYSKVYSINSYIGEEVLFVRDEGELFKGDEQPLGIDENGVLFNDSVDESITFNVTPDGCIYNATWSNLQIDNDSDDLYTYINLDILFQNENATYIIIKNTLLDEVTEIKEISENEVISISAGQFIISDIPNKIFGDTFNFVWPRLRPGINEVVIDGNGKGSVKFSYRYPIKIGDCAININNLIGNSTLCKA